MSFRVATCLLLAGALVSVTPCLSAEAIEHQLQIQLQPESGFLRVSDAISLASLTTDQGVDFLLNAALEIVESRPAVERIPLGEVEGDSTDNVQLYNLELSAESQAIFADGFESGSVSAWSQAVQ